MIANTLKLNTANTTNLTLIKGGQNVDLLGVLGVNTSAYEIFIKFYWMSTTQTAVPPTVGTTVPNLTLAIPALGTTTGVANYYWSDGITMNGPLYFAVTKLAADSDTTVVVAGDGIITILYA
jgi:hypothetical protein